MSSLFEISLTPAPANPDTRILATKGQRRLDALAEREGMALLAIYRRLEAEHKAGRLTAKSAAPIQVARFEA